MLLMVLIILIQMRLHCVVKDLNTNIEHCLDTDLYHLNRDTIGMAFNTYRMIFAVKRNVDSECGLHANTACLVALSSGSRSGRINRM